ncbi:MAG: hypothetical protein AB7N65_06935 [Vicinamibacterales bacterium]
MATVTAPNTFLQRLIGALSLDRAIYEEVEADERATVQAFLVVLGSSVAAGLGVRELGNQTLASIVFFSMVALLTWAGWALLTFEIGTRLMPEKTTRSDVGELLRTLGFAATPGLLRVLGIMPAVMLPVFAVTTVWMLAAMVVAVRQALDYQSTSKAIAVCVLGLFLSTTVAIVLGVLFGPTVS